MFTHLGGFDEGYQNGSEDVDLCMRLRYAGYRNIVSHQSPIYHRVSSSPGRLDYVNENMERFLNKWKSKTIEWGRKEWPSEYFQRYARHFWKMTPTRFSKALYLLTRDKLQAVFLKQPDPCKQVISTEISKIR